MQWLAKRVALAIVMVLFAPVYIAIFTWAVLVNKEQGTREMWGWAAVSTFVLVVAVIVGVLMKQPSEPVVQPSPSSVTTVDNGSMGWCIGVCITNGGAK